MFNINTLALKDTTTLQLRHPVTNELLFADEEKTKPVSIELYGTASKAYRNAVTAMQNRTLRRNHKKEKVTAEIAKEEGLTLLLACSVSTSNLGDEDGPISGQDGFRKLYTDARFGWIKEQVDEAIGDVSNFLEQ